MINKLIVIILSMLIYSCGVSVELPLDEALSFLQKDEIRKSANEDEFLKHFKDEDFRFKAAWCAANKNSFKKIVSECDSVLNISNKQCFKLHAVRHCIIVNQLSNEVYDNSKLSKRVRYFLSNLYKHKLPTEKDYMFLSQLYFSGSKGIIEKNISKAIITLTNSCKLNHKDACLSLSDIYGNGINTSKDIKQAYFFAKKACLLNSGGGCANLAVSLDKDNKDGRHNNKIFNLLKKSCSLNYAMACSNLATYYAQGIGTTKNSNKYVYFANKACSMNSGLGCYNLAIAYRDGNGVTQNYNKAFRLFDKSCDLNYPNGCKVLGLLYLKGLGVSKNYNQTVMLFRKACRLAKEGDCEKIIGVIEDEKKNTQNEKFNYIVFRSSGKSNRIVPQELIPFLFKY